MQSYQRFQHIVHTVFNTSGTNALRSLSRAKVGYTLGFAQRIVHKGLHGETGAVSDGGGIITLGVFRVLLKRWTSACQKGLFAVF